MEKTKLEMILEELMDAAQETVESLEKFNETLDKISEAE